MNPFRFPSSSSSSESSSSSLSSSPSDTGIKLSASEFWEKTGFFRSFTPSASNCKIIGGKRKTKKAKRKQNKKRKTKRNKTKGKK